MATITYFLPDKKKSGGAYVTVAGAAKKIDAYERKVVLTDERKLFPLIDRLGAALLMPQFIFWNVMKAFYAPEHIPIYGDSVLRVSDRLLIQKMANTIGASFAAFCIGSRICVSCSGMTFRNTSSANLVLGQAVTPDERDSYLLPEKRALRWDRNLIRFDS